MQTGTANYTLQRDTRAPAAIVTNHVLVGHQIAFVLHQHWMPYHLLGHPDQADRLGKTPPDMLIVDIDDPHCNGLSLLRWFREVKPNAPAIALCRRGSSPAMREARQLKVNGFFYLCSSGGALDPKRGVLPTLLRLLQ